MLFDIEPIVSLRHGITGYVVAAVCEKCGIHAFPGGNVKVDAAIDEAKRKALNGSDWSVNHLGECYCPKCK